MSTTTLTLPKETMERLIALAGDGLDELEYGVRQGYAREELGLGEDEDAHGEYFKLLREIVKQQRVYYAARKQVFGEDK